MKLFLFVCLFFTLNYGVMASSQQSFDIRQGSMNVEQESMNLQECNSQKDRVARSMSLSIQKKAMIPPAAQYLIAAVVVITLAFYIVRCLRSLDKKTSMRRLAGAAGACGGGDDNGDQPEGDLAAGPAAPAVQEEAQVSLEVRQALQAAGIPLFDENNALPLFRRLLQRGFAIYPDGPPQSSRLAAYFNHLRLFDFMVQQDIMPLSAFIYHQFAMNTISMERIIEEERTLETLIQRLPNITDDALRAEAERRIADYRAREAAQARPAAEIAIPWMPAEFQWLTPLLKLAMAPIRLPPSSIEEIFAQLSTGEIVEPTEIRRLGLRLHQLITQAQSERAAARVTREAVEAEAEARRQQQQQQQQDDDEEFQVPPGGQPGPDGEVE